MHRILQQDSTDDFLICSGNVMSLDELIQSACLRLSLNKEMFIRVDPPLFRPNELYEIYGDPSKAKSVLHWKYTLTNEQLVNHLITDEDYIQWKQDTASQSVNKVYG